MTFLHLTERERKREERKRERKKNKKPLDSDRVLIFGNKSPYTQKKKEISRGRKSFFFASHNESKNFSIFIKKKERREKKEKEGKVFLFIKKIRSKVENHFISPTLPFFSPLHSLLFSLSHTNSLPPLSQTSSLPPSLSPLSSPNNNTQHK